MLRAYGIDIKRNWDNHWSLDQFSDNNSYHSSIPWLPLKHFMVGDVCLLLDGLRLVILRSSVQKQFMNLLEKVCVIRDRLITAYSQQNSYPDNIEFELRDIVYLKISPMREVMRFGKNGKLNPRFVGFYKVIQKARKVGYELRLPSKLSLVHQIFYVSLLKKCIGYPVSILPIEGQGKMMSFL